MLMKILILGNDAGSMPLDRQAELECNWLSECEGDCVANVRVIVYVQR